ncbi:MAG: flagellar hook-length control protein FliK [Hydrogenophaga sp.]|uniref:flagellar hook-length control protein FliK n=1 Tax=Hydrogenophaga sp. TaxID=1904254 RepID=UPI002ABC09AB|nr:flagellar hook-length control protein FliK [Hydrogenophaga sp.]MDZ4282447.1 flagellar hook-length control protein FliK [Hydrogenophaga sp.]
MSSTTATASAPKPVENMAKPAQAGARAPRDKTEGTDMFANLLGLLASTQVLPEAATIGSAAPAEAPASDAATPDSSDNPFAALLGWDLPGSGKDTSDRPGGTEGTVLPAAPSAAERTTGTGSDGKIDISDMTPVEPTPLEATPKGQVALPANAVRPGAPYVPTRAAEVVSTATAATAGTSWRQASLASTETVALQQASNHISQARSTVALNERFGLTPGVPLAASERREYGTEGLSLVSPMGAGSRTADAAPALSGATAGDANMGSDNTGPDARAFDQGEGQTDNPFADANAAEEPTVTHWGTQHLRHASLRVAGDAGEQAIDIQLSMKGQEVQVAFNTDNAEARASLRESAGESLSDLLAKSGIQLGGVSVGAQGQSGARGDDGAARQGGARGVASAAREPLAPSNRPAQAAPRADGSQPLDVFA